MRERVMRAARELGYTPNAIARSLITRRSNLLAVLISNLTNLYFPEALSELSAYASARGERILLFPVPAESDVDHTLEHVLQYQVDGVIAAVRLNQAQVERFERRSVPLVLFNRFFKDRPVNSVCCDQAEGARLLVSRLYAANHRRFAVIAGPSDSFVGEERLHATVARLKELGINDAPVIRGHFTYEGGRSALREVLKSSRRPPQAIVCANDVMALGCIDGARYDSGLSVPDQLSVVGFDGVGPAAWAGYELTTIRQPIQRMAEGTIALLMERIEDPTLPPERRLLPGQLVEGRSARLR